MAYSNVNTRLCKYFTQHGTVDQPEPPEFNFVSLWSLDPPQHLFLINFHREMHFSVTNIPPDKSNALLLLLRCIRLCHFSWREATTTSISRLNWVVRENVG